MNMRILVASLCVLLASDGVCADPVTSGDVSKAQAQMLSRVANAVDRYAVEIGIDRAYVTYCRSAMYLQSFAHPANGAVPFGVDYNRITDSDNLKLVLTVREEYETSFLILCLANAKNALRDAKRP